MHEVIWGRGDAAKSYMVQMSGLHNPDFMYPAYLYPASGKY